MEEPEFDIYATDKDGDGHVVKLASQELPITIYVGHFAPDVVITIEEKIPPKKYG
ncbi:MAG: hypothetical protein Q7K40_01240 [bacterium]|nr:hypothetical protein [bacterium]